ncbi:MAG: hypothetical protein WC670_17815 [Pseudolabrys sp.]|jgi:hypothetical protein
MSARLQSCGRAVCGAVKIKTGEPLFARLLLCERDDNGMRASLKYGNARRGFAAVPSELFIASKRRGLTRGNVVAAPARHPPKSQ